MPPFCLSVLDSQFLASGWLLLLPLLLISILESVDLYFLQGAAFGPSMYALYLKCGNNISCLAEALARLNEMMLSPTSSYISSVSYRYYDTDYLLILLPSLLNQWLKCKYLLSATHLDCILLYKSLSIDTRFSSLVSFTFPHVTTIKDAEGLEFYIERDYLLFFYFPSTRCPWLWVSLHCIFKVSHCTRQLT